LEKLEKSKELILENIKIKLIMLGKTKNVPFILQSLNINIKRIKKKF
jgi:hypothetical protein